MCSEVVALSVTGLARQALRHADDTPAACATCIKGSGAATGFLLNPLPEQTSHFHRKGAVREYGSKKS